MASAVHRVSPSSIPSESFWAEVAERLRQVTVRIDGGNGVHGAGVIWSADGLIVTNAHVVNGPAMVRFPDGRGFHAELLQRDRTADLAVMRISAKGLRTAEVRDAKTLRPGEVVIAVGHPLGTTGAVSMGVVHTVATGRWIQSDVRLVPGNSGGPLADAAGRLVGINSMVVNGIGMAISSGTVQRFLSQVQRARLGATFQPALVRGAGVAGVGLLVVDIEPGGAAHLAGIVPGDLLVRARGQPLSSPHRLAQTIDDSGAVLYLDFVRQSALRSCRITLGRDSKVAEGTR
jgi:serine protease Do